MISMDSLKLFIIASFLVAYKFSDAAFYCTKYDSNMGANFDLTELQRTAGSPPYLVEDGDIPCTKNVEQNFTYVFNVCGTVSSAIPNNCYTVDGYSEAAALQIDKRGTEGTGDDYCYMVGRYDETQTKLALLDQEDPTKGLQLTYYGQTCSNNKQRSFNIQLTCSDKMNPSPTHALEYAKCEYTITMPSVYGCPLECPISNRAMCAGNGHCAYDDDKPGARCFCNKGWTGTDCATEDTTVTTLNYSPALLGLIITLFIIVIGLIGSIAYMVRQLQAYKEDMANYQVLKSSEGDISTV